jgi:hypothetical protein
LPSSISFRAFTLLSVTSLTLSIIKSWYKIAERSFCLASLYAS